MDKKKFWKTKKFWGAIAGAAAAAGLIGTGQYQAIVQALTVIFGG